MKWAYSGTKKLFPPKENKVIPGNQKFLSSKKVLLWEKKVPGDLLDEHLPKKEKIVTWRS